MYNLADYGESYPVAFLTGANSTFLSTSNNPNPWETSKQSKQNS